jgi:hypothetical protein
MHDGRIFVFFLLFLDIMFAVFLRVVAGHSKVVKEKDGEVLCMLNIRFCCMHYINPLKTKRMCFI